MTERHVGMRHRLESAVFDKIEPVWGPERERAIRAAITHRAARRTATIRGAVLVAATGLMAVGALVVLRERAMQPIADQSVSRATTARQTPADVGVAGGATVTPLSPETVLAPLPDHPGRGFALRAGGARFAVPHDATRPFVVTAGDVTVEDLGTTFTVRFVTAARLNVAVEEGRVHVHAGETDTDVSAGMALEVPVSTVAAAAPKQRPPLRIAASSWRPLAEGGQYEEARSALRKAGPSAVHDDTADLLLAADAARLSGHPAEAVPYLQRVLHGHAKDPRAGLAAFTLGRVLLDELGRPHDAADAFAAARSFGGPLAEDALAREVEAAARAGDASRSRELALLYRRLYANGRRANAVSRFGGLD